MNKAASLVLVVTLCILNALGQNQNISTELVFEGEPFMEINPMDSNHIIVSWMAWVSVEEQIKIKSRTSFDGGETWSDIITLAHVVDGYTSADSVIAFGPNGNVYITYIDSSGTDNTPIEGGIYLCTSQDGGLTFSPPTEVLNIAVDPDRIPIDRPWMVIDNSSGPNSGAIYITTMNVSGAAPSYHPYVSISIDEGATFTWQELDAPNWLSGNLIQQPMPTPAITNTGVFQAVYPSFVSSQNTFPQYVLVSSTNAGQIFNYSSVFQQLSSGLEEPLAKKG